VLSRVLLPVLLTSFMCQLQVVEALRFGKKVKLVGAPVPGKRVSVGRQNPLCLECRIL